MLNKTKAAMPGRQWYTSKRIENDISTVIDQVNACSFAHISFNYGKSPGVTAAMARLPTVLQICNSLLAGGMRHWRSAQSPNFSGDLQSAENSADTWLAEKPADQPFGSIPRRISSARANPFSQLPRLTPSRLAASFNCCRSSGVMRIWKVGDRPSPLGVLSLLIVDMYVRNLIVWVLLCTYVITSYLQKATPRTVRAVPRRLTKPLIEVTVMADIQSTQTHPEFTWRFLAVSESHPQARAVVVYTNAPNEAKARSQIKGCVLYFAARLPVHHFDLMAEVRHV